MLNIEHVIRDRFPQLADKPALIRQPTVSLLKRLTHESEVNHFLNAHQDAGPFEFVDEVLERFQISYQVSDRQRENIPTEGRVVIVSNHPLGTLDGLALLKLVGEIRRDVKIVANDMLMHFDPLSPLLLAIDVISQKRYRAASQKVIDALTAEEAVIIFPAGEVSRAGPTGIKDGRWQSGFLHFARKTNTPILPVHVSARNSALFYSLCLLYRPIGSLLLVNEMFKKHAVDIPIRIGELIPLERFDVQDLPTRTKIKLLRKHVYRLAKGKSPLFATEKSIAHPEDCQAVRAELRQGERLGNTADGKQIWLLDYAPDSAVMREIGRLREMTFRRVGEGTGSRRDLDHYDREYRHLILWDDDALEIVGAYRIAEASEQLKRHGRSGLYSASLFRYSDGIIPQLAEGIELGRSFVQPRYWGKRSLDYLWFGIGAYLRSRPHIKWMFGPVTLSNSLPTQAKDLLVTYYRHYYGQNDPATGAIANAPYRISAAGQREAESIFEFNEARKDFIALRERLDLYGATVPTLYKQYTEVCEEGGIHFLDFSVDADFGYCIDGLVMVDISKLKPRKRERYMGHLNPENTST